ncbi:MAG: C1 family peptidase [Thermoplasmatota archaeon]
MRDKFIIILISLLVILTSFVFSGPVEGLGSLPEKEDDETRDLILYDGLRLSPRPLKETDIEFLMENEGVASAGEDYNVQIGGAGTGLKPPTSEEWDEIASSFYMLDDISFASPAALSTARLHNQSIYFPPIGNQGAEGSCVSWSIGYYTKTWQEAKDHDWNLSGATMGGTWPGQPSVAYQDKIMSPDFLYHQVNNGVDGGSYYSDTIFLTQRTGICSWKEMPYNCYNSTAWPSEDAWREAPKYRSMKNSTYYMYTTNNASLNSLKTWIDGGNLATISINAYRYDSLVNELWNNTVACGTGRNHANTIIGYDDNYGPYQEDGISKRGAFLVANSWGKGWSGDSNSDGMYWISYGCMMQKVQYVYLMADMIDYEPKAIALFNISHAIREECTITLGIGPKTSPLATKQRYSSFLYDGGPYPFPSNKMAYDITEFNSSVSTFIGYNYFIKVQDGGSSTTGSIQHFSIELFDDYDSGPTHRFSSNDPVVATVNGGTVYAEVTATDDLPPSLTEDRTPGSATTGDPLNFTVVVVDNGLMDRVTVEYRSGSGPTLNTTMTKGSGDTWYLNITAPDSLENITYLFHAGDTGGNWNETSEKTILVSDNDDPVISPTVPSSATTGDPFPVSAEVIDNIEVEDVTLEHWYDSSAHTNSSMTISTGNNWTRTLNIEDRLGTIHLIIKSRDTSGNTQVSGTYDISITDNDLPTFGSDLSDAGSTTGELFKLSATFSDNIGISSVWASYSNGDGFSGNSSLDIVAPGTWAIDLASPDSTSDIGYSFHFNDTSDNWNSTISASVTITDNDLPTFRADSSPTTGTTGEMVPLRIEVEDNIQVSAVHLEYWFGSGTHQNISMSGPSPYTLSVRVPVDSTDELNYIVHACDNSGNWNQTSLTTVLITDNDLPHSWSDSSMGEGTTGDIFRFELSVSDNIGIQAVYVEYWFGEGQHFNVSMTGSSTFDLEILIAPDNLETLHYVFHAVDGAGNWNSTVQIDAPILDDDLPEIGPDTTQGNGRTGDPFSFSVQVIDNIGISAVFVEYWFGAGEHVNATMAGSEFYHLTIDVPADSLEILHYLFRACDASSNWNATSASDVEIVDDDLPRMLEDASGSLATTGDGFEVNVSMMDNLGIDEAWLEYWFGEGEHLNVSMSSSFWFVCMIPVPIDSLDDLYYRIHFCDGAGNWNSTHIRNVTVADNDLPTFGPDVSLEQTGTGSEYSVSLEVLDNIGLSDVFLEFWFGSEGGHTEIVMTNEGSVHSAAIDIPIDSVLELHYIIKAFDLSGSSNSTTIKVVSIIDTVDPAITPVENIKVYAGEQIRVSVEANDNIGIVSYIWEGAPFEVDGYELVAIASEAGDFEVTVSVLDGQGNSAATTFTITVLPVDNDEDGDGIPDLVEIENGMDMKDPEDAGLDDDGDGLSNLEEYLNGTSFTDDDTDDDGMPDGWEVSYGLDPKMPSSNNDQDKDGIDDIDEYKGGTDPLVPNVVVGPDEKDEPMDLLIPAIILAAVILAIIMVIVLYIVLRKGKKGKQVEGSGEEVMSWD